MPTPTEFAAFHFDQRSNDGTYANHGDAYSGEFTTFAPIYTTLRKRQSPGLRLHIRKHMNFRRTLRMIR